MKFKKMLCGLAAFVTMLSACVMPVSADVVCSEPSFLQDCDLVDSYELSSSNGNLSQISEYYIFTRESGGYVYEVGTRFVIITVEEDTDTQPLCDLFGDTIDIGYYEEIGSLDENQFAFKCYDDFDYESLYEFENVEKVNIVYYYTSTDFYCDACFSDDDAWVTENQAVAADYIQMYVSTDSDVELTEEMFADTGFNDIHIYKPNEDGNLWYVYYKRTGEMETVTKFINETLKIDGIVSVTPSTGRLLVCLESGVFATEVADTIGDINGDGVVNISDIVVMKKYMLENIDSNGLNILKSDMNKDGSLSVSDFVSIKKKMLK